MTEEKHYIIMKKFAEDVLQQISVDEDPVSFLYDAYIKGYTEAVIRCHELSPAEANKVRKLSNDIRKDSKVKCEQVNYIQKYNSAVEYLKNRLSKTDTIKQVLSCASTDEVIHLYETAWHSHDTCDFYDEYEELESKYLIIKKEVVKMKITVYDSKMNKLFCETGVEDFNIYKSGSDWCIGYTYFDEGIEMEKNDADILIQSSSEEATDDLVIVKQEYGHLEFFASPDNIIKLNAWIYDRIKEGDKHD